jgi:hypothetical protein
MSNDHFNQLNRDRVQRHRDKQKQSGLVKVEIWVKPEFREQLLVYAKELR